MKIAFYGDSLTVGLPGSSYFKRLGRCLPEHSLINYGKINDTTLSLHRRIVRQHLLEPVDLAFVWIGVNDILTRRSWLFSRLRPYFARDAPQFLQHYRVLLNTLTPRAARIVTVPPVLIGEDLDSPFNQALADMAVIIETVSADFAEVRYLNLRNQFIDALEGRYQSKTVVQNVFQSTWDAFRLRTDTQIEQVAVQRGLHLTLDGVHLNTVGAVLAADTFATVIREYTPPM